MYGKRKRPSAKRVPYAKRAKRARAGGRIGYARILTAGLNRPTVARRVNQLYRMIETRESATAALNINLNHNTVTLISFGAQANLFHRTTGANAGRIQEDEMTAGHIRNIGDRISIKGCMIKCFLENTLGRPKTFYRLMLLRGPRGADFTTCMSGISGNKMIDQVNTEKFHIVAQKLVNVTASNAVANVAQALTGAPTESPDVLGNHPAGIASKIVKMWVPGTRFTKDGNIQYENESTDVKFYDYRFVILCYDWYGTPVTGQVGKLNEGICKFYYKDA